MRVLVMVQGRFGGTDFLLRRLCSWLKKNGHEVAEWGPSLPTPENVHWDWVVLPTSELWRLFLLKFKKNSFNSFTVWAMGHAALRAAFVSSAVDARLRADKYNVSVGNIYRVLLGWRARVALTYLLRHKSILFTDEVGANADISFTGLTQSVENIVFPIAVEPSKCNDHSYSSSINELGILRICWLGRVDLDFKVYSLLRLLDDINNVMSEEAFCYKIKLVVIGDGDGIDLIRDKIKDIGVFSFDHLPYVAPSSLDMVLHENADLLFSMGTSSLDGAKNRIPTVVVQPMLDMSDCPENPYRWVYDSRGFSLGEFRHVASNPIQKCVNLGVIIREFFDDPCKASRLSYKYAEQFFVQNIFTHMIKEVSTEKYGVVGAFLMLEWFLVRKIKVFVKGFGRVFK